MDWLYLALVLAFLGWSIQLVLGYRRQSAALAMQIQQAQVNQEEVMHQAESYEAQAEEKKAEQKELNKKLEETEAKEKELQKQIIALKQREASRRPTRHKVESSGQSTE